MTRHFWARAALRGAGLILLTNCFMPTQMGTMGTGTPYTVNNVVPMVSGTGTTGGTINMPMGGITYSTPQTSGVGQPTGTGTTGIGMMGGSLSTGSSTTPTGMNPFHYSSR